VNEPVPLPPPTIPASPLARELEAVVERVTSRVLERIEASNLEVKQILTRLLDEVLEVKRRVDHLEARVTAHDVEIAALTLDGRRILARVKTRKGKRRAARSA